jgi:hypothetical protein
VRYGLDLYILFWRNSVFKGLICSLGFIMKELAQLVVVRVVVVMVVAYISNG